MDAVWKQRHLGRKKKRLKHGMGEPEKYGTGSGKCVVVGFAVLCVTEKRYYKMLAVLVVSHTNMNKLNLHIALIASQRWAEMVGVNKIRRLTLEQVQANEERKACMCRLYESGMTYEQIAETFGISYQRVYQMIGGRYKNHFRSVSEERCIYIGLRKWLNTNRVTVPELTRRLYGAYYAESAERLYMVLRGNREIKKTEIDKILKITGLTYEEAFLCIPRGVDNVSKN